MKYIIEKKYKAKYKKGLIHFSYFHRYDKGVLPHWNTKENAHVFKSKKDAKNFINKWSSINKNETYKIIKL